jgi:aquaporin Z
MSTIREHWPEYLIEAGCLAVFMVSAAFFATLLNHPSSPVAGWIASPALRRIPMGIAMGLTAVGIIYSRLGQRSGAHMNPAVTLAFLRLGRIQPRHALGYIVAQFLGGLSGIAVAVVLLAGLPAEPPINYVATVPGPDGPLVAALAEAAISFVLMSTVLIVSSRPAIAPYTGMAAGTLVAFYIAVEDPLSGMSMNPARTLGPALLSGATEHLWVYFTAPGLGMVLAAEAWSCLNVAAPRGCAKLHHPLHGPCIFRCGDAAHPVGRKEAAAA